MIDISDIKKVVEVAVKLTIEIVFYILKKREKAEKDKKE